MERFDLVVTGELLPGAERGEVLQRLAALFKCAPEQAARLLAGRRVTVKSGVEREVAERYCQQLLKVGVGAEIRPQPPANATPSVPVAPVVPVTPAPVPPQREVPEVVPEPDINPFAASAAASVSIPLQRATAPTAVAAGAAQMECPKCGSPQPEAPICAACGVVVAKFLRSCSGASTAPAVSEECPDELAELLTVVGDNPGAYRDKFRELLANDGNYTLHWHWPAFFSTFPWLFYRRLYAAAAIVAVLSFLPLSGMLSLLTLLIPLSGGLCGNYLYFRHCRARLTAVAGQGEARRRTLAQSGGVMPLPLALFGGVAIMVLVAMLKVKTFYREEFNNAMAAGEQAASMASAAPSGPTGAKMVLMGQMLTLHKLAEVSARRAYTPPADMDEVRVLLQLQPQAINDEWGTALDYAYSEGKGIFYSAGPDKSFETDDDVVHEVAL